MIDPTHTPSCFASHMGAWAILPDFLRQALTAIRSGLWRPEAKSAPALPHVELPTPVQDENGPRSYYVTPEGVGILPLHGPSMKQRSKFGGYSSVDARRMLREMAQDPNVGTIMLHVDSPGGHVAGTQELAQEVDSIDVNQKPVHAYIEDNGNSAAYWIVSQARTIAANPMAYVGSLGVIAALVDDSEAMAMEGIKVHVIATGDLKGTGAPGSQVTEEQIGMVRRLVEGTSAAFQAAVRSGRALTLKATQELWTGDVWLAEDAKAHGLVDKVESWDAALERVTRPLRASNAKARLRR